MQEVCCMQSSCYCGVLYPHQAPPWSHAGATGHWFKTQVTTWRSNERSQQHFEVHKGLYSWVRSTCSAAFVLKQDTSAWPCCMTKCRICQLCSTQCPICKRSIRHVTSFIGFEGLVKLHEPIVSHCIGTIKLCHIEVVQLTNTKSS